MPRSGAAVGPQRKPHVHGASTCAWLPARGAPLEPCEGETKMLTVLVVEDDANVARSVQVIVQRCCGGEALVAPTAAVARRILAERANLGALVIDEDLP